MSEAVERVLTRLDNVKRNGTGWTARCPAHEDRHNSLSIGEGDDGCVLLHCHAGCEVENIAASLDMAKRDLFPSGKGKGGGAIRSRNAATVQSPAGRRRKKGAEKPPSTCRIPPEGEGATPPDGGCTLARYAEAKQLPVEFLRKLGLSDITYLNQPAVRIPYHGPDQAEIAVRIRKALRKDDDADNRFCWKKGSRAALYGIWRVEQARQAGYITVVEGESDCHTLWLCGVPAIGLPGAATWKEEWAACFDGIPTIYVVIEPDRGGEGLLKRLSASQLRERVCLVRLGEHKDPSGLYVADPDGFSRNWQAALDAAESWKEQAQAQARAAQQAAFEQAKDLIGAPDILERFADELTQRGVAGETRTAKILYLALVSRLLERPVSIAVKGPSSGGKSYITERVLDYFPPSAYYARSGMSDRALAYSEEPLKHRMLVLYEASAMQGDFLTYLLRSLLSEGRVSYETVEKTKDGMRARLIEREGPTGLIVTTTAVHLHPENETRILSIPVTDTPDQTRAVLRAIARRGVDRTDFRSWHALQGWLEAAEHRVVIPYAEALAEAIPPVSVRLRRDFHTLLSLIRAHAILHQASRDTDADGQVVATLQDYAVVRALIADLMSHGVQITVPQTVRETVEAVRQLCPHENATANAKQVAERLDIDPSSASRRIRQALDGAWLVNHEAGKGKPMKLTVGDPLPEDRSLLPEPAALQSGCAVAELSGELSPPPSRRDARPDGAVNEEDAFLADVLDAFAGHPTGECSTERPNGACYACNGHSWWKRTDYPAWVCGRCHPPVHLAADSVIWFSYNPSDGR